MELPESQLKFIFEKHQIEYIKKLGSGGFGSVYLGNSIGQDFLPLAVKCITRKQLAKKPSLEKYLAQEINSMYSLKHANIVRLLKTFVEAQSIFLVMEYCEYGNLYSYQFGLSDKVFRLSEATNVFLQLLRGLRAIHQEKIIHRDLKCENILLKKVPRHNTYTCKIGDFGFAKELSEMAKSHCGTPNFMAPEILADEPYDQCVDLWSLGVILFYMLFADYPFKGLNLLNDIENKCADSYDLLVEMNPQLIRKKNKSLGEKELSLLRHFFSRIFVINPAKRMTISEMSKHPLFKDSIFQLDTEPESTESSESVEEQRLFALRKFEFLEGVESAIRAKDVLKPENQLLLKYFLSKVSLCVLGGALKQIEFTEEKAFRDVYSRSLQKADAEYRRSKSELQKLLSNKVSFGVKITQAQLSSSWEKFDYFKDIYRIFMGYVFAQVHGSNLRDKEKLKMRVLCCHTINRVFEDGSAKYFANFNAWIAKKEKKARSGFSFQLFNRWTEEESQENISKTISAINDYFYSKK